MTYKIDVKIDEARHENAAHHHNDTHHYYNNDDFYSHNLDDDDDVVWQAVSVMVLPGMVWVMCCLKAWQFQHLLSEAEQEAQERIRSEWSAMESAANGTSSSTANDDAPSPRHDEELALQNPSATLS